MDSGSSSLDSGVAGSLRNRTVNLRTSAIAVAVALVLLAEVALFFDAVDVALGLHLTALLFAVLVPVWHAETTPVCRPFALLPLFRLVNLGVPIVVDLTLAHFLVVYLPLLPAVYLVVRAEPDLSIGWDPRALAVWALPAVGVAGALGVVEYAIIEPEPLIPEWSVLWVLAIAGVMLVSVGLVEELLFRGILQRMLGAELGRWTGVVLASVLFGAMHSIYGSGLEVAFAICIGLVFGVVYERTDSLGLVTLMHAALNVALFAIVPYNAGVFGLA